eukprot:10972109-Alexandrium_andersonii.AAC.1
MYYPHRLAYRSPCCHARIGVIGPPPRNTSLGYSDGGRAFRSQNMRNCLRHSKLALRRPRNGLNTCTQSFRAVRSALLFAQMQNLPTRQAGGRAGGASRGGSGGAELPSRRFMITIDVMNLM